jgi:hypothetical protein
LVPFGLPEGFPDTPATHSGLLFFVIIHAVKLKLLCLNNANRLSSYCCQHLSPDS